LIFCWRCRWAVQYGQPLFLVKSRRHAVERGEVVEALLLRLFDADDDVRRSAALTLAEVKDARLGNQLLPYVRSSDSFVRVAALRALRELCLADSLTPALDALTATEPSVRREAVSVLGYLKNPVALGQIEHVALLDDDPAVRRAAVGALLYASDERVVATLTRALSDQWWEVREEAASTLGRLGSVESGAFLIGALSDDYWQVRVRSAIALGRLRVGKAVSALSRSLTHEVSNLRKESALALGEIGDVEAVPSLERALEDRYADVRKFAALALRKIGAGERASS
jgi:HEAT repeat protein